MKFTVYQGTRRGPRPYNQDRLAYSYSKDALMLAMADGMGGHHHGEIAAQLAIRHLSQAFQKLATPELASPNLFLKENIHEIHDAINDLQRVKGWREAPRTTLVVAVIQRNTLYIAHVGDSRLYHFRDKELIFRTEDHSVVQMMLRRGEIRAEDMQKHPQRHKIYNCLGGEQPLQIELSGKREILDGDILMLCTDGLWATMSDREITLSLHYGPVNQSAARLLQKAEALGKQEGDNISVLAIQWGDPHLSPQTVATGTMPLGAVTTIIETVPYHSSLGLDAALSGLAEAGLHASLNLPEEPELSDDDLTEEEIERTIASIQAAIHKSTIPK